MVIAIDGEVNRAVQQIISRGDERLPRSIAASTERCVRDVGRRNGEVYDNVNLREANKMKRQAAFDRSPDIFPPALWPASRQWPTPLASTTPGTSG